MRVRGKCIAWKSTYGFLKPDGGGSGVYVHWTELQMAGHRALNVGDVCEWDYETNDHGPCAANVRVIEPAAEAAA